MVALFIICFLFVLQEQMWYKNLLNMRVQAFDQSETRLHRRDQWDKQHFDL